MRVLIADKFETSGVEGLRGLGCEVVVDAGLSPETLPEALASRAPEVLIVRSTKVPAAAIRAAKGLRAIIRAGAGVDNIDREAATAAGIGVCNCPGTNADAVAELAMGLLIACDRRIPEQVTQMRAGRWNKKEFGKARGLKGRTLGVVGLGAIGMGVVRRAQAFGMAIEAWDRSLAPKWARALGMGFGGTDRASLLQMVGRCDAVSIHVALGPETKGMCDAAFFRAMREGAIFINTSRGAIVDEQALTAAVKERGVRAGLDVYAGQPGEPEGAWECALASLPGVVTTHHCGASTDQAQQAVAEETVRIVRVYRETGALENCVNPEAVR